MEKCLSAILDRHRENCDFSRWEVEQKHEKVLVLVALVSKLRNFTTVVHRFSSRIDLDRYQELKYRQKKMFYINKHDPGSLSSA